MAFSCLRLSSCLWMSSTDGVGGVVEEVPEDDEVVAIMLFNIWEASFSMSFISFPLSPGFSS